MKQIAPVLLIGISSLTMSPVQAAQPPLTSDADVISEVQKTNENAIQAAALRTADQIRQIPGELRARGVEVTTEEEARINGVADQISSESSEPEFKVIQSLRRTRHGLSRAGIDTLKALGYTGDAVSWVSLSPLAFGADLATGAVLGRGVISTGAKNSTEETLGGLGGVLSVGYAYAGLCSIGFTFYGPILASGLGLQITESVICRNADTSGKTERDRYCKNSEAIHRVILGRSARMGEIIGDGIHEGIMKTAHAIEYPFRDRSDNREDDLGN